MAKLLSLPDRLTNSRSCSWVSWRGILPGTKDTNRGMVCRLVFFQEVHGKRMQLHYNSALLTQRCAARSLERMAPRTALSCGASVSILLSNRCHCCSTRSPRPEQRTELLSELLPTALCSKQWFWSSHQHSLPNYLSNRTGFTAGDSPTRSSIYRPRGGNREFYVR